jgi:hypothetical protein
MPVEDYILRSPALTALRVRREPAASSVAERLEQLRDEGTPGKKAEAEIKTADRLLALACLPGDCRGSPRCRRFDGIRSPDAVRWRSRRARPDLVVERSLVRAEAGVQWAADLRS